MGKESVHVSISPDRMDVVRDKKLPLSKMVEDLIDTESKREADTLRALFYIRCADCNEAFGIYNRKDESIEWQVSANTNHVHKRRKQLEFEIECHKARRNGSPEPKQETFNINFEKMLGKEF